MTARMWVALAAGVAILAALGTAMAGIAIGTASVTPVHTAATATPAALPTPAPSCAEDDVCWDCATMGDRKCGPRLDLDVPLAEAMGGSCTSELCWIPGEHAVPDSYPCHDWRDTCWIRPGRES